VLLSQNIPDHCPGQIDQIVLEVAIADQRTVTEEGGKALEVHTSIFVGVFEQLDAHKVIDHFDDDWGLGVFILLVPVLILFFAFFIQGTDNIQLVNGEQSFVFGGDL
jgi:hypothetical protein